MINEKSISKEWLQTVSKQHKADISLVEKLVRAFLLLEGLAESGLNFVFKGGTSLMLLFDKPKRLSIDIDIIVPDKNFNLTKILQQICIQKGFNSFEKANRNSNSLINKEHYKLLFSSALYAKELDVLLDVLYEDVKYNNLINKDIKSIFLFQETAPASVKIPDFNNILGD
ncbi:MAG: nucleotidyl transferase AbiEii/AbiGii toxin family protein, partial [Prevotellaceae bacterium]|nr:nucleotidyl transferase AbiEii/AbiGii toxin family protein [Prevotellaceae bacterium]